MILAVLLSLAYGTFATLAWTYHTVENARLKMRLRHEQAKVDALRDVLKEIEKYEKDVGIKNLVNGALSGS